MTKTTFEADLDPETRAPRMRYNLANGWTVSIVLRQLVRRGPCDYDAASLAVLPTGQHGQGKTELGETEASADELAELLAQVAARPTIS